MKPLSPLAQPPTLSPCLSPGPNPTWLFCLTPGPGRWRPRVLGDRHGAVRLHSGSAGPPGSRPVPPEGPAEPGPPSPGPVWAAQVTCGGLSWASPRLGPGRDQGGARAQLEEAGPSEAVMSEASGLPPAFPLQRAAMAAVLMGLFAVTKSPVAAGAGSPSQRRACGGPGRRRPRALQGCGCSAG